MRRQLDDLRRNLDAMDPLVGSDASLSSLMVHWSRRLLVISELHRQQTILLYAMSRSNPDRIVNLVQRQFRPIVPARKIGC